MRKTKTSLLSFQIRGYSCSLPASFLAALVLSLSIATSSATANQCVPPVNSCSIEDSGQFLSGHWDVLGFSGQYEISGNHLRNQYPDSAYDHHRTLDGSLDYQIEGGVAANHLLVNCDGTITGKGSHKISGTYKEKIDPFSSAFMELCLDPPPGGQPPFYDGVIPESEITVDISREYDISGSVTANGQLDLNLSFTGGSASMTTLWRDQDDCYHNDDFTEVDTFPLAGESASVRYTGSYDAIAATYTPTTEIVGTRDWLHDFLSTKTFYDSYFYVERAFLKLSGPQVTPTLNGNLENVSPYIEMTELDEPKVYLQGVNVDSTLTATIDWRNSKETKLVDFSYGQVLKRLSAVQKRCLLASMQALLKKQLPQSQKEMVKNHRPSMPT